MSIDLKKEHRKLIKNLETIFDAVSMKPAFSQPNLQSIVEKQLNILSYLENVNKTKIIKSTKLLTKYNELTSKHFTIDSKIKYDDQEVLVDDINYLPVYIRNIFKIDLDALAEGKEAKIVMPTVNDAPQQQNSTPVMPFMMPGMAGAMGNLPPEQNPMYTAAANARIHQESIQGKVYLFKTKPKFIPLLKWIIAGLLILFSIACIFVGMGMMFAKNSAHALNTDEANNGFNAALGPLAAIFYFVIALFAFFLCYRTAKPLLINTKNENALYSFQWQFYLFLGILFLMLIIFGGSMGPDFWIFKSTMVPWTTSTAPETGEHAFGLWAWFIGYVLIFGSAVLLVACIAFGSLKGPKVDTERLQALMRQYISEAIKAPPPAPPMQA
ncbi:MAG: hypothetical protein LBJ97_03365 [Mycoplasmataceae bacterium]|nr:hypothetical protein [Mycoplasmataceae bacterium]